MENGEDMGDTDQWSDKTDNWLLAHYWSLTWGCGVSGCVGLELSGPAPAPAGHAGHGAAVCHRGGEPEAGAAPQTRAVRPEEKTVRRASVTTMGQDWTLNLAIYEVLKNPLDNSIVVNKIQMSNYILCLV